MNHSQSIPTILLILCLCNAPCYPREWSEPLVIHQDGAGLQLAYNPRGAIGVDSQGRVHLVYEITDDISSPPDNQCWYRAIVNGRVSDPSRIDSGPYGGGRHPVLAIDSRDTVHVTWQDYRHTTALGKWINNIEIYYDRKSADGAFLDADIRVSHTEADHAGDNGYVPRIAVDHNGRVHIAWYDFTANGTNADVYLRSSNESGGFTDHSGIEEYKITSFESGDPLDSNWLPDIAVLPDDSLYVVWGFLRGFTGIFQLQGRMIQPDGSLEPVEIIADKGGRHSDPPRLAADRNGNLGLVYVTRGEGLYQIQFQYRPGGGAWSSPRMMNDGTLDATQPNLAFDSVGRAWIAWQEDLGGQNQIRLAVWNPARESLESSEVVSGEFEDARTPALALHPATDQVHLAWLRREDEERRSLVYRYSLETAVRSWIWH